MSRNVSVSSDFVGCFLLQRFERLPFHDGTFSGVVFVSVYLSEGNPSFVFVSVFSSGENPNVVFSVVFLLSEESISRLV